MIEPTAEEEPITISSEDDPAGRVVEYTVSSSGSNNTIVDENGRMMQVNAAPEVNSLDPYFGQLEEVADPARNARPDHRRVPIDVVADTPSLLAGEHCIVSQKFYPLARFLTQIFCIFSPTLKIQATPSQTNFCNTLLTSCISPLINQPINGQIRMTHKSTPALDPGEENSENSTGLIWRIGVIWNVGPSKFDFKNQVRKVQKYLKKLTILSSSFFLKATLAL